MNTTILFFNGPPGAGKDYSVTAASKMIENATAYGKRIIIAEKFAKSVKEGTHGLFGLVDENGAVRPHDYFENSKNTRRGEFMGMTPREAYIWYSEEVMKPKFGKDIFGKLTAKRVREAVRTTRPSYGGMEDGPDDLFILFSDSGFAEEVAPVLAAFPHAQAMLFRLHKEGCDFKGDSRSYLQGVAQVEVDVSNDGTSAFDDILKGYLAHGPFNII